MTNQTERVDVLAALDLYGVAPEVRTAVAELINTSNKVANRCWMHMGNDSLYEIMEMRAALARIGGDV